MKKKPLWAWKIYVVHDEYNNYKDRKNGYTLEFDEDFATCVDLEGTELWKTKMSGSADVFQCALEHFIHFLIFGSSSIKKLIICGKYLENFDFGVIKLSNLRDLDIDGGPDINQFLTKIGQPLRKLEVRRLKNSKNLTSCEENLLDLESPMKTLVIKKMEPDDRTQFAKCSKQSRAANEDFRSYLGYLHFDYFSKDFMNMSVSLGDPKVYPEHQYFLEFSKEGNKKYEKCMRRDEVEKQVWETKLDPSTELLDIAVLRFKNHLQRRQSTLRSIHIQGPFTEDFDFGDVELKNLEELGLYGNYTQLLFKLQHPLKKLSIHKGEHRRSLAECEQIYRIRELLSINCLELTNQQFLKLSAPDIHIHIGSLTVDDVFNFITSWQKGTIGKPFKSCQWNLKNSNFDKSQLYRRFGIEAEEKEDFRKTYYIIHFKDDNKKGYLCYYDVNEPVLHFYVTSSVQKKDCSSVRRLRLCGPSVAFSLNPAE